MKKYITFSASADGAHLSVSEYQGVSYIIAPVISAVGDKVIFPANAPYPEFVPGNVLSLATESRNFRPVVMNHPWDDINQQYCSANSPKILEKYRFGFVFNSRFEDNRVKCDIWLDPLRALEVGPDAVKVIERLQAGEIVEVSEGSYVIVDETPGIHNGDEYGGIWELCIPDHLAVLSEGIEGACSVNKHGCGANRVSNKNSNAGESSRILAYPLASPASGSPIQGAQALDLEGHGTSATGELRSTHGVLVSGLHYTMRTSVLGQARSPKFTGTETSNWSTPTFSQYIKYLYPGSNGPKSVSQCSSELKREISSHSLLGDPEGKTLLDLTLFPVVNPSNGKLNEKALQRVISGKGKPDDLPESAYQSAIDTAKRLLNSEFGSSLEVAKVVNKKPRTILSKLSQFLRDNISNNQLRNKLWDALKEVEPGLWYIEDYDHDDKTVVYSVRITMGSEYEYGTVEIHNYQRSYNIDSNNIVTVNNDRIEVEFVARYEPVKGGDNDLEVSSQSESQSESGDESESENDESKSEEGKPDKPCQCKGDQVMAFNRDQTVRKLVASKKFTETELKSASDSVLKALEESLEKPAVNEPAEENKSANRGDKTIIENTPENEREKKIEEISTDKPFKEETVTLTKEKYNQMVEKLNATEPIVAEFQAQQAKRRDSLVKVLSTHQTEYKETELKEMTVPVLERMAKMLKVEQGENVTVSADYTFARSMSVESDDSKAPPVPSVSERIRMNREKKSA